MGDLAVGENFVCCLIIAAIFIAPGRTYRLEGRDFEVIIYEGGKLKRDGTIFIEKIDPSRHHVKMLIWHLEEG